MEELVGKTLGNCDIIELVGKGGMATVYKGHQQSINRSVAVKVMAPQYSSDSLFIDRFKNEAHLIAQLEHAHILPVYDFGEQDGLLYIVMRYLPTGTLEDRIDSGRVPVKEAVAVIKQVASALDYAHSQGIIHRDLKPANILIDAQGNTFLSDFGIAKSLEAEQNLTGTGGVVGTPTYMSPEQGLGENLDARTDIYALGVMLYEMLTGRVPFTAENPMAVMLKHMNDPVPDPREYAPDLAADIVAVVTQAMAKEPINRHQSAGEFAQALEFALKVSEGTVPARTAVRRESAPTQPSAAQAPTVPAPVPGAPSAPTASPAGEGAAAVARQASPLVALDEVHITMNGISAWLGKQAWLGIWLQGVALSLATFVLLMRLTQGALLEVAILSVIPGVILYALLRAPLVATIASLLFVFAPLLAHAPGLAVIWLVVLVIAGSRLSSREIMLMLVTTVAAGSPFGWLIPLLAPWWLRARRVVVAVAAGVMLAVTFAITLDWPDAGGLLPVPRTANQLVFISGNVQTSPFDTTYLELFEDASLWEPYLSPRLLWDNLRATSDSIGYAFEVTRGLPLIIAAAWGLAAALAVSNRRVDNAVLRASGIALGFIVLVGVHVFYRPETAHLGRISVVALVMAGSSLLLTILLSQWPIQVDPAAGSKIGTNLHVLRRAMGAFYAALGVAYFVTPLSDFVTFPALWLGASIGVLVMIGNPFLGPVITMASIAGAYYLSRPVMTIAFGVLLFVYVVVSFLFDRRRPRRWTPLGAGIVIGAPGLANFALLPVAAVSIGALESQVPAVLLMIASHVVLVLVRGNRLSAVAIVAQFITALVGVLVIERLMASSLLGHLHQKLRRLIFTVGGVIILSLSYYTIGNVASVGLGVALLVAVISGAFLVAAMGDRAMFWRQFIEPKDAELLESASLEDEITGRQARA